AEHRDGRLATTSRPAATNSASVRNGAGASAGRVGSQVASRRVPSAPSRSTTTTSPTAPRTVVLPPSTAGGVVSAPSRSTSRATTLPSAGYVSSQTRPSRCDGYTSTAGPMPTARSNAGGTT